MKGNDDWIWWEFGEAASFYEADACGDCNIDTETQMHSLHSASVHYYMNVGKISIGEYLRSDWSQKNEAIH